MSESSTLTPTDAGNENKKATEGPTDDIPMTFPQRLMEILSNEDLTDTVTWLPNGKGFIIYKKKRFAAEILPKYFKQSKFTSFTRKLNRWGFTRVTRGPETGSYFHKYFLRDQPRLCMQMSCQNTRLQSEQMAMEQQMQSLALPYGLGGGAVGAGAMNTAAMNSAMGGMSNAMGGMSGAMGGFPGAMGGMPGAMGGMPGAMGGMAGAMGGMPGAMGGMPGAMGGMPGAMGQGMLGGNSPAMLQMQRQILEQQLQQQQQLDMLRRSMQQPPPSQQQQKQQQEQLLNPGAGMSGTGTTGGDPQMKEDLLYMQMLAQSKVSSQPLMMAIQNSLLQNPGYAHPPQPPKPSEADRAVRRASAA